MDGHFVPNLTIGPPVVASLRRHSGLFFDCHLMMTDPGRLPGGLRARPAPTAARCTSRSAAPSELVAQMRALGLRAGLAANPDTPFEALEPYLDQVDLVLCMTVFPGFGGQAFMAEVHGQGAAGAPGPRRAGAGRRPRGRRRHRRARRRPWRPRPGPTSSWPAAPSSATSARGRRPRPSARRPEAAHGGPSPVGHAGSGWSADGRTRQERDPASGPGLPQRRLDK